MNHRSTSHETGARVDHALKAHTRSDSASDQSARPGIVSGFSSNSQKPANDVRQFRSP